MLKKKHNFLECGKNFKLNAMIIKAKFVDKNKNTNYLMRRFHGEIISIG